MGPRLPRGTLASIGVTCAVLALGATTPKTPVTGAQVLTPAHAAPSRTGPRPRASSAATRRAQEPSKSPEELASEARSYEELGAYGHAIDVLRTLRRRVEPDADLELTLALDEARTGHLDSARVRLWGPVLTRAMSDSLPPSRRHPYAWKRDGLWINGRFDGWHWYVARARAEVAAALGQWGEAEDAAKSCVVAQPRSGKEWLILAVCAGRAGDTDVGSIAVRQSRYLDASLPEARYLEGLYLWKSGAHSLAQESFREALALDSTYRAPAIALVRTRLPLAAPDTLPGELLTGERAVALLTSPERPKLEEFVQMDVSATLLERARVPVPDSLHAELQGLEMVVPVMIDARGRIVLHEFPWFPPERLPAEIVNLITATLPEWRFEPAKKNGVAQRVWSGVQLKFEFN